MCLGFFVLSLDIYRTAVFSQVIYYKYFINRQIVWNSISLFAPVTKSTKFFQKDGDINMTKKPERRMLQRPMSPPQRHLLTMGSVSSCPGLVSRPCLCWAQWPGLKTALKCKWRPDPERINPSHP